MAGDIYAEKVNLISEITTNPTNMYVESNNDKYIKKIAISDLVYRKSETYSKSETYTKSEVDTKLNEKADTNIINIIYPVGSIYLSVVNVNPQDNMPGTTWVRWGQGRVPVGMGQNEINSDTTYGELPVGAINRTTVEEKGGQVRHALTQQEMPRHNHTQESHRHSINSSATLGTESRLLTGNIIANNRYTNYATPIIHYTGGEGDAQSESDGLAHDNMQPYITCYMWKRTA